MMQTAPQIQRFNFQALQDFAVPLDIPAEANANDAQAVEQEAPVEPPPPATYSEAEMEAAKREAHAKGLEEGKSKAETEAQTLSVQSQQTMVQQMKQLGAQLTQAHDIIQQAIERQHTELLSLSYQIAKKLAEDALKKNAQPVLDAMLRQCLPQLLSQPAILIKTAPDTIPAVESLLGDVRQESSYEGEVSVREDSQLQPGDLRIDWQFGSAERSYHALLEQLDSLFPAPSAPNDDPPTDNDQKDGDASSHETTIS